MPFNLAGSLTGMSKSNRARQGGAGQAAQMPGMNQLNRTSSMMSSPQAPIGAGFSPFGGMNQGMQQMGMQQGGIMQSPEARAISEKRRGVPPQKWNQMGIGYGSAGGMGGGLDPQYSPPVGIRPMNPEQKQQWMQTWQNNQNSGNSMIGDTYGSANPGPGGITGQKLWDWQQQQKGGGRGHFGMMPNMPKFGESYNQIGAPGDPNNSQYSWNRPETWTQPWGGGTGITPEQRMKDMQGGLNPNYPGMQAGGANRPIGGGFNPMMRY